MPGPCPPKLQPNLLSSAQEISFTGLFPNQALLLQVSPVRGTGACDYGPEFLGCQTKTINCAVTQLYFLHKRETLSTQPHPYRGIK